MPSAVNDEQFRHFGKEIIAVKQRLQPDSSVLDTLYLKLYKVPPPSSLQRQPEHYSSWYCGLGVY